jgi:polysaccharide biosynthesis protein PslH
LVVIRNWSRQEKEALKEELENEKYDLIHAEAFYVMPHIPKTNIPTILVEQTIEYMVYKHYVDNQVPFYLKPFYMLDVIKCRYWERHYWRQTDRLVAVSPDDKVVMRKELPGIQVDIIPNGVDANFFAAKKIKKHTPARVMYGVTNFEWLQNVEAVDILINKVWPTIHQKMPDVKLWIVGRAIPKSITDLSKKDNSVVVTESIEDARDAYAGATVMVAPIQGSGGTRLKILEAMAAALPIVATPIAVAGLDLTPNKHALVSDSPEGLADLEVKILKDLSLAKKIGTAGQKFVQENYDWKQIVKLHDDIYNQVVK